MEGVQYMKKFLIAACAGAASLGLVACEDTADETAMTDDGAMTTDTMPPPPATVTDDPLAEPTEDIDGDGDIDADDRVTIDEDGIEAEINDGDTSVTTDIE
jgi:hypothetical protein